VIDLDGVMWRGSIPIPGSADTVRALLDRGDRTVFASNNSTRSGSAVAERLVEHGLPRGIEVITSADAVTSLVVAGEAVLVLGSDGLRDALASVGAEVSDASDPSTAGGSFDAVVVGLTREIDYDRLDRASDAARRGARLIASNTDSTFPAAGGIRPGCGAIVAAVATAAGVEPAVAGKPHRPMADRIRAVIPTGAVVVGDRLDTDGELAHRLGWPFGLVLSGVTAASDLPSSTPVAVVADDLARLVARIDEDPALVSLGFGDGRDATGRG
jgi:glycerol-1-phosphatase